MPYTTLISPRDAAPHLRDPAWVWVDCRFTLGEPGAGRTAYAEDHVPGAAYADLERDLSGAVVAGRTGRHPLPEEADFDAAMGRLGVSPGAQVVTYDAASGALAAARLWWLLRWAGHEPVAVLDGGLARWRAEGLPVASGWEERQPTRFEGWYRPDLVADAGELLAAPGTDEHVLLDVRAGERYRGEHETIDPVAGHIPGAASAPYAEQLTEDGRFLDPEHLRRRFEALRGAAAAGSVVFYCGSGVTAAHGALAYAHAGLGEAKVYPGSWSEWITDPARPRATGEGAE